MSRAAFWRLTGEFHERSITADAPGPKPRANHRVESPLFVREMDGQLHVYAAVLISGTVTPLSQTSKAAASGPLSVNLLAAVQPFALNIRQDRVCADRSEGSGR